MSLASTANGRRPADAERRERILEGAERAFVRHGFHAATMQDVADELGMSAGNLYRYFPSKEAIVEGLCAVDQGERAQAFAELMADKGDIMEAMCAALRRHVLEKPPEKARLIVEIWAEAGRNPAIASMCGAIDANVRVGLTQLVETAKAKSQASPQLDAEFAARVMITVVVGLFKRRAHESDFDGEQELALALGTFAALFDGAISPLMPKAVTEGE